VISVWYGRAVNGLLIGTPCTATGNRSGRRTRVRRGARRPGKRKVRSSFRFFHQFAGKQIGQAQTHNHAGQQARAGGEGWVHRVTSAINRRGKDIGQMLDDATTSIKNAKDAL
jgi:hypothetical protein